ncbi:hypothetical protein ARMSODRAFT_980620 [Armillaria solidipes]|uniref:Uncharacterized protein n=1 Tax=Armillaria solidipes TaxID=1076256 RepID=A0A2H3B948_9AGAR|nr:hypothetical protein ARMSODRAFT_980620 [Armillaria solidipes]
MAENDVDEQMLKTARALVHLRQPRPPSQLHQTRDPKIATWSLYPSIPKFHPSIHSHCTNLYPTMDTNFRLPCGLIDSEAVERFWATYLPFPTIFATTRVPKRITYKAPGNTWATFETTTMPRQVVLWLEILCPALYLISSDKPNTFFPRDISLNVPVPNLAKCCPSPSNSSRISPSPQHMPPSLFGLPIHLCTTPSPWPMTLTDAPEPVVSLPKIQTAPQPTLFQFVDNEDARASIAMMRNEPRRMLYLSRPIMREIVTPSVKLDASGTLSETAIQSAAVAMLCLISLDALGLREDTPPAGNYGTMGGHSTASPPRAFTEAIDSKNGNPMAILSNMLQPFNKLYSRCDVIVTRVYRQVGCMELWKEATQVLTEIQEVVNLLQDLLCSVLSGVDELHSTFHEGTLAYLRNWMDIQFGMCSRSGFQMQYRINLFSPPVLPDENRNRSVLPARPTQSPMHLFDARMQQTMVHYQDTYEQAIQNECTETFWTWFIAMWARKYPESFTHPWQSEYDQSIYDCYKRIENWMDALGGQQAKDDLAAAYCDSSSSNASASDNEDGSDSTDSVTGSLPSRSSTLCIASDIDSVKDAVQADEFQSERLTMRKQFARQRRLQARIRVFAWRTVTHANGVEHISEWERLDVDAWAEATGYTER